MIHEALAHFRKENGMKLRTTSLTFVSLLLIGSLAGAATLDGTAAPASASPVASLSPLCLTQVSTAKLPSGNPAVMKTTQLCGACSDIRCKNNTLGNVCASGGYTCQNIYGNFCPEDGLSQCKCSNWPPF
jgi:hypothetical protein